MNIQIHFIIMAAMLVCACKKSPIFGHLRHDCLSQSGMPIGEDCWHLAQLHLIQSNYDLSDYDTSVVSAHGSCPGFGGGDPYTMSIHIDRIDGRGVLIVYVDLNQKRCWEVTYPKDYE